MMNKVKYYLLSFSLLALFVCSCSETEHETNDGAIDLSFTLEIPGAIDVTRAYDDNSVRNIDLLVFNASNQFVERIQVNAVLGVGSTKVFAARLTASATQRTIHVIANARGEDNSDIIDFSHITTGTLLATAITGLESKVLAAGQSPELPLIMWGRVVLPSITSSNSAGTIKMLRMNASMYVKCDTPTTGNGLNDFTLIGFSVVNASDRGRVAPSAYTADASIPSTPTLPSTVNRINYAVDANNVWASASAGTTSELYLYDKTNSGNQNTDLKIIIRALWKGVEGYYPVWMSDGTSSIINVVRNHRYGVTVKGVYGTGYATLTEAINAIPASNQIIVDTSADITDIITDGQYLLGLSANYFTVAGSGTKTVATVLKTNTSYNLSGTSNDSWITGITFTSAGTKRWTMSATFVSTTSSRTGTITVRAGSLTRTVAITQTP